jgi:integrase
MIHNEPISFKGLRQPEGEQQVRIFTMDEVDLLAHSSRVDFRRHDLADLIIAAAWTGARQNELLKLTVGDINFDDNVICIGGRKGWQTKGKDARQQPICKRVLPILKERCRDLPRTALIFGEDWESRFCIRNIFEKVRDYALPHKSYPFKQIRHSFCTALMENGTPLETVRVLAGHKSINTTLRYARATTKAKQDALDRLEAAYEKPAINLEITV